MTKEVNMLNLKKIGFCLLTAFVFLAICSKNSFIYPMNDWPDVNCFHTVGRSMVDGQVLYRDIYEQKGPILYFIYALIAMFFDSFIGVFFLEIITGGTFLYVCAKIVKLYDVDDIHLLWILPTMFFAITTSNAFFHGGSVEEMVFPCIAFVLYSFLKLIKTGELSKKHAVINGLCVGLIFWIKYSMLGAHIGAYIFIMFFLLFKKKWRKWLDLALYTFIGFAVVNVPVVIYCAVTNSFADMWEAYFYNNIFLYGQGTDVTLKTKLVSIILNTLETVILNLRYSVLVIFGVLFFFIRGIVKRSATEIMQTLLLMFSGAFWCVLTFFGGLSFDYYGLTLCVFSVFGYVAIAKCLTCVIKIGLNKKMAALCCASLFVILPILSWFLSPNTYLAKYSKEEMPQYVFAEIINLVPGATILNYNFLDGGFYYAADVEVTERFFCMLGVNLEEKNSGLDSCIDEGRVDFVITRNKKLDSENYVEVKEMTFELENMLFVYRLYKKTEV